MKMKKDNWLTYTVIYPGALLGILLVSVGLCNLCLGWMIVPATLLSYGSTSLSQFAISWGIFALTFFLNGQFDQEIQPSKGRDTRWSAVFHGILGQIGMSLFYQFTRLPFVACLGIGAQLCWAIGAPSLISGLYYYAAVSGDDPYFKNTKLYDAIYLGVMMSIGGLLSIASHGALGMAPTLDQIAHYERYHPYARKVIEFFSKISPVALKDSSTMTRVMGVIATPTTQLYVGARLFFSSNHVYSLTQVGRERTRYTKK